MGLNQISLFEAKIANGNGEQSLSRDIYRLGHRFDFFRMLSCYFTTVGYYFSTMVINGLRSHEYSMLNGDEFSAHSNNKITRENMPRD